MSQSYLPKKLSQICVVHDDHDYYYINTLITYDILIYYVVRLISKLDSTNISN